MWTFFECQNLYTQITKKTRILSLWMMKRQANEMMNNKHLIKINSIWMVNAHSESVFDVGDFPRLSSGSLSRTHAYTLAHTHNIHWHCNISLHLHKRHCFELFFSIALHKLQKSSYSIHTQLIWRLKKKSINFDSSMQLFNTHTRTHTDIHAMLIWWTTAATVLSVKLYNSAHQSCQ